MSGFELLEAPIKSKGDTKSYRLIKLNNGLKALLVQKATEKNEGEVPAAANLSVNIGHFNDPRSAMGLAHFLEHVVFLGSKKYPKESGYHDFLMSNGGERNATTEAECTSFFFSIPEKSFPEALDRLEQMVESPLLLKSSLQREREAVDSEFQSKRMELSLRLWSMMQILFHDAHPASQFFVGNLQTLKEDISDDELHAEVLKLHGKYTANKMCLAIQSSLSLDDMQALVLERFSSIKRGVEELKSTFSIDQIIKPDFYNKNIYMKALTPKTLLIVTWVLPSMSKHYKCSPLEYIAEIFGNSSEGGIKNYLIEQHLATNIMLALQPNSIVSNSEYAVVRMVIEVTDFGYKNIEKVLGAIASYLLMIKEAPISEHRRLYQDLQDQSEVDFDFHKESKAMTNVTNFASNMLYFENADILRGSDVYQHFDEQIIRECIEHLNEEKFNILVMTDKHEKFGYTAEHYGTEYDVEDRPESYQTAWTNKKSNPEFFLQKPNPFKTTNFEIFTHESESTKYPSKVFDDGSIRLWHKLDKKYNMPHVHLEVLLSSPIIKSSKDNFFMLKLLELVFDFNLPKKMAQASKAGYKVSCGTDKKGFKLHFNGFNDKMALLVDLITKFLPTCTREVDEQTFKNIKKSYKEYFAMILKTDNMQLEFLKKLLLEHNFEDFEIYRAIDDITMEDLQKFSEQLFGHLTVDVLAQGNITKDQALIITEIIRTNINFKALPNEFQQKERCYQLPLGNSTLRLKSLETSDDTYTMMLYQVGPNSLRIESLMELLETILNPKAFDFLRTKEQLGYRVDCGILMSGGVIGFKISILSQEHKHKYGRVLSKMEEFMVEIAKKAIEELTDEDFEIVKDARIKKMLAEDVDLHSEFNENKEQLEEQDFVFYRRELAAVTTRHLTKADLQGFFKSFTQPENMRRLTIQVVGSEASAIERAENPDLNVDFLQEKLSEGENLITDIDEFRSNLPLFPVVKVEV